jgi:hypothetical protein
MRSPLKIAAPWSPCLSFYVNIADGGDVGRQPLSRKSRLREFMLALRPIQFAHASFASGADKRMVRQRYR